MVKTHQKPELSERLGRAAVNMNPTFGKFPQAERQRRSIRGARVFLIKGFVAKFNSGYQGLYSQKVYLDISISNDAVNKETVNILPCGVEMSWDTFDSVPFISKSGGSNSGL